MAEEERKIMLCYRRLSMVKNAGDLVSPEKQKKVVDAMVTNRYELEPEWYEDIEGHSSGRTSDRDGWQELLAQLDRPDIAGVAAYDLSRLYRNVQEFLKLVYEMNERKLRLVVVNENVDTHTAIGVAILTIFMVMYQLESDLASERMKSNIQYKRETMGIHWGPVPFGCMRNEEKVLIPDPKTWDSLRYLYGLFATGDYTYDQLVDLMNDGHHPWYTRQGDIRPWQQHDVRRVLCAWQLYQGHLPLGRQKDNPTNILEGAHDPILPVELCDRVGDQLRQRRRRVAQTGHGLYLLTPIVFCGHCGAELAGNTKEGKRLYRHAAPKGRCPEVRCSADFVEAELIPHLAALADSQELQQTLYEEITAMRAMADPQATEMQKKIDAQIKKRDRLTEGYIEGIIEKPEYIRLRSAIDKEIARLEESMPKTALDDFEKEMWRTLDTIRGLEDQDPRKQKEILLLLLDRIEITGGHITKIVPKEWTKPFF